MKPVSILQQLEARGFFHIKPGLDRVRRVLAALGNPQDKVPAIHIAGTNGKGSVAATLESVLRKAGYRTGLYTSPHLIDITERIQLNRRPISTSDFAELARLVMEAERSVKTTLTYFEFTTVMGFLAFARGRTQINVVEVGMGGLWDATNILRKPLLTVITSIGLDHQRWLGGTEAKIAAQKAGIIKKGVPLISGVRGEGKAVVAREARRRKAVFWQIDDDFHAESRSTLWNEGRQLIRYHEAAPEDYMFGLVGAHQADNAAVALSVLHRLQEAGMAISDAAIRQGLREVHWSGRFQWIQKSDAPPLLVDGAHNPAGTRVLLQTLQDSPFRGRRKILIFGAYRDKDVGVMAQQWHSQAAEAHLVSLPGERGMSRRDLRQAFRAFRGPLHTHASTEQALKAARAGAAGGDTIIATGSLTLVGEVLGHHVE